MNKITTQVFKTPQEQDKFVNDFQHVKKVFATQTHVGFDVGGNPISYVAVIFYREDD